MPRETTAVKKKRAMKIVAALDRTHPEAPDGTSLFAAAEKIEEPELV